MGTGNSAKSRIPIPDEECMICGAGVVVITDLEQKGQEHESWWAYDGDDVECEECGALAMVTVSDQVAQVQWDELSEHNVACAEKVRVKESGSEKA